MNLILLEPTEFGPGGAVTLTGRRAAHLRLVLNAVPGLVVRVGVIDGPTGEGEVLAVEGDRVALRCTLSADVPERPRVDLLLAMPRPKVLRRLWAQLSSIGVGHVMLTNAGKVERDYFGSRVLEDGGYRALLLEGLEQARDTRLPVVSIHKRLKVLIEDDLDRLCPETRRLVAHPAPAGGRERGVVSALDGMGRDGRVLAAVGPEGGWNDFELALLESHGFARVDLGPRTLATTTACVALLALVHDALRRPASGDLTAQQ